MNTNEKTLNDKLTAMISAAAASAECSDCDVAVLLRYEDRRTIPLPSYPCIYVYAICKPNAHIPYALYIGQSVRDARTRLNEHLRRHCTEADGSLCEALDAGCAMRIYTLPVRADDLNRAEAYAHRFALENVYSADVLNCARTGANHMASGAGCAGNAPFRLRALEDIGAPVEGYALSQVSAELDALEETIRTEEGADLPYLDDLGALRVPFTLQVVALGNDGAPHILIGAKMMLAARRAGSATAYGRVVVVRTAAYAGGDERATAYALRSLKDAQSAIPHDIWHDACNIGKTRMKELRGVACPRAYESLARLLIPAPPSSDSQIRALRDRYVIYPSAVTAPEPECALSA